MADINTILSSAKGMTSSWNTLFGVMNSNASILTVLGTLFLAITAYLTFKLNLDNHKASLKPALKFGTHGNSQIIDQRGDEYKVFISNVGRGVAMNIKLIQWSYSWKTGRKEVEIDLGDLAVGDDIDKDAIITSVDAIHHSQCVDEEIMWIEYFDETLKNRYKSSLFVSDPVKGLKIVRQEIGRKIE